MELHPQEVRLVELVEQHAGVTVAVDMPVEQLRKVASDVGVEPEDATPVIDVELTDPHHVTAGYTGEPGSRTFYVQAADEVQQVTLLLEKTQVGGIGELLSQLLARVDDQPATDWDRAAMDLREPVEPRWRVGAIQVGLDPERGRFLLEFAELVVVEAIEAVAVDDVDEDALEEVLEDALADAEATDAREARLWLDQDQARRLAAHCAEVIGQGRPRCELCGRPIDADGRHVCPATNGHGQLSR
jgi:uncharacterized repeat protein (TIGR03847 family)